jgi:hypothetical protein|tara:strand:+ start:441 stop:1880 length:1440 start_codon:yes stop_codon:yes gene_type:complete
MKLKQKKFKIKESTLGDLYNEVKRAIKNLDPENQRPSVQSALYGKKLPTKSQSIIQCIFDGYDLGEFKWHITEEGQQTYIEDEEDAKSDATDGSNRGRAIVWFKDNKFPIHDSFEFKELAGKYWDDLTEEQKNYFNSFIITEKLYLNMSEFESARQAVYCNTITAPNRQMVRNFHKHPIAKYVRDSVRGVSDPSLEHTLFEHEAEESGEVKYSNFEFSNDDLGIEEKLSQVVFRYYMYEKFSQAFLGTADQDSLDNMYKDEDVSDDMITKIKKLTNAHLKHMLSIRKKHGKKFNGHTWTYFSRQYFWMQDYNGHHDIKITDYQKYYDDSFCAYSSVKSDDLEEHREPDGKERLRGAAFAGYLGEWGNDKKVKLCMEWPLEHFDCHMYIKDLDPIRIFPRDMVKELWIKNNKCCAGTGLPTPFENIVGGHIIAHSKGGRTTRENCVPLCKDFNAKQGDMDFEEFKKIYHEKIAAKIKKVV